MHRTKYKRISKEAELLKRLRLKRDLTLTQAAELSDKSLSWISHVENGRVDVTQEHIDLLAPIYGQTSRSFRTFLGGTAYFPSEARRECMDALQELPDGIIDALYPLILNLKQLLTGTDRMIPGLVLAKAKS